MRLSIIPICVAPARRLAGRGGVRGAVGVRCGSLWVDCVCGSEWVDCTGRGEARGSRELCLRVRGVSNVNVNVNGGSTRRQAALSETVEQ